MIRGPRNWITRGKGEYRIVENREIGCHPDDFALLRENLKNTCIFEHSQSY